MRKQAPADPLSGMVMEMGLNSLAGLFILLWLYDGQLLAGVTRYDTRTVCFLFGAGWITTILQIVFVYGLQRSTMLTIGFMQYLTTIITNSD